MLTALVVTGILLAPAAPAPASVEDLVRRLEARHRTLRDLSADFVQTYRSGVMGREVTERGTVAIKPPGRMRWDYRQPEKKTFVSDGRTFYFYVPADRQVIVREQDDTRGLAAQLLSGRAGVLSQFQVREEEGAPAGLRRLRLTPLQPDAEVDWASLDLDAEARIRAIVIVDAQGNRSQFRFEKIRENTGLGDEPFRFTIPRGVEVVSG